MLAWRNDDDDEWGKEKKGENRKHSPTTQVKNLYITISFPCKNERNSGIGGKARVKEDTRKEMRSTKQAE